MTSFVLRHPRWSALVILVIGAVLAFLDSLPALHNDDIQQYFTVCNGGVGDPTPFALHTCAAFGCLLDVLASLFPAVNGYLVVLLLVASMGLLSINEFVIQHRAQAGRGPLSCVLLWVSVMFLVYINQECLRDQQVQYTHVALVAGGAAALVLYDALCTGIGWKRLCQGAVLFLAMYFLRPEALMSFCFFAAGSVFAWVATKGFVRPHRSAVCLVLTMLVCAAGCLGVNVATYSAHDDWADALDYRKTRVCIQDYPDNSGLDKSAELSAAGIDPVEFAVFKSFTYVPSMDDMEKIHAAKDVHQQGCHGLLGVDGLVKLGLLQPEAKTYEPMFKDFVFLTQCVPFALLAGVSLLLLTKRSARAILPSLFCVVAYVCVLLLAGRFGGRVLYPAMFYGCAWVLAFLPADAKAGRSGLVRWGVFAVCLLTYAVCMRHYRPNSLFPHEGPTAADICASHPENIYFSTTFQRCPMFDSGFSGCTRGYWASTNVVPIADGWIFYTPAYRAFLKARGISNPYLMAAQPHVFLTVKDAGDELPGDLQRVDTLYHFYTGKHLSFRKVWEDRSVSCWKAEEQ